MYFNKFAGQRSGFTIVELAIVLVVIGIILGMAVKGKALVETARLKAEIAKLYKFEAANAIYFTKTGNIAPNGGYGAGMLDFVKNDIFTELGLLTAADFKSNYGTKERQWIFFHCSVSETTPHYYKIGTGSSLSYSQNVCATTFEGKAGDTPATSTSDPALSCHIEAQLDDQAYSSGTGMHYSAWYEEDPSTFKDCNAYGRSMQYGLLYAYKVF